jgi:hypothetical protein
MARSIVPVKDFGRRMVEHGRIRLGIKAGRAMKSIDTFRFTSADETAIRQLAEQFGGEARPWSDPKASPTNQWEVVSQTSEIPVWIIPGGLDVNYEMWSGGGCVRRCDGVECETSQRSFDADYEPVMVPCVCSSKGKLECRPYTRLNVIIPSIRFGGSWRLESKGWNAAEELPGMAEMLANIQDGGHLRGRLRLEHRQSQGGRRKFVVPTLAIDVSVNEMLTGNADVRALVSAPSEIGETSQMAIPSVSDGMSRSSEQAESIPDDDIVEAVVIEDDVYALPNAPREEVELSDRQIEGLLSGSARWSESTEGLVVKA